MCCCDSESSEDSLSLDYWTNWEKHVSPDRLTCTVVLLSAILDTATMSRTLY